MQEAEAEQTLRRPTELAVSLSKSQGVGLTTGLAVAFLLVSLVFVYRSFYGMRIVKARA